MSRGRVRVFADAQVRLPLHAIVVEHSITLDMHSYTVCFCAEPSGRTYLLTYLDRGRPTGRALPDTQHCGSSTGASVLRPLVRSSFDNIPVCTTSSVYACYTCMAFAGLAQARSGSVVT